MDTTKAATIARVASLFLCLGAADAAAQGSRLLPVGDPAYVLIERLQRRGHLLALPPTALPYAEASIRSQIEGLDRSALNHNEETWVTMLDQRVAPAMETKPGDGVFEMGHEWTTGGALTNGRRLDPMRPLRADTATLSVGGVSIYPRASVNAWMARGPFVAQLGLRLDALYEDDPDGLDLVKRLWVRNQEAYVGARVAGLYVYAGRFGVSWAPPEAAGLLVSANPRPFDRISYAVGGGRFTMRGDIGELDSATDDGRFTGRTGDSGLQDGAIDRFVVAHRFDWRPIPRLMLSVQESAVYSGANAGWSPMYMVPTFIQFFGIDNAPKNVENNGLAAGQLWAQVRNVTVQGQFMLDDFDIQFGREPTAFSLAGTLTAANLAPSVDGKVALTVVSARSYNTDQRPGIYVYALRGLATPFSDYVHASLGADLFLESVVPGLVLTPTIQALWQGEASFLDPPLAFDAPTILTGTAERTLRVGATVAWQPQHWLWARADLGVNRSTAVAHVAGTDETRFVGQLEFGARLRFGGPVRLQND